MDTHTHTCTHRHAHNPHCHCGSPVLCCGRLKWPLWAELNISVHSGRASQCLLPPAASALGTSCQPARRPTSLNPCQAPDATLGGPASCGSGMARLESPPTSPSSLAPSAAANNLTVFPMWSSTENQSELQVIFLSSGRMWMYCIFEGFWRSEK